MADIAGPSLVGRPFAGKCNRMPEITVLADPAAARAQFAAADASAFPDWNHHPLFGDFARALYAAINEERPAHAAHPFCVMDGDAPVLMAEASLRDDTVSMYGLPLALAAHAELGQKRRKKVFQAAFEHMAALAPAGATARIAGGFGEPEMGLTDLACIDRLAAPMSHLHAVVDATRDETGVHKALRSSFRSLVNWGRDQLTMHYVNADNPDRALFDALPAFHTRTAGAGARGVAYWEVFWREVSEGRGEVSLGYLADGSLASGTAVVDAGAVAYYASGVYDREKFDKPLAHFPVFDSIVRAGARGNALYDLGEVFPASAADDKEVQIGFFKKGFTDTFRLRTVWNVPLGA